LVSTTGADFGIHFDTEGRTLRLHQQGYSSGCRVGKGRTDMRVIVMAVVAVII